MIKAAKRKRKGVWIWGAAAALLVAVALFSTQAFAASIGVTAQPVQNAGSGGELSYNADWSGASTSPSTIALNVTADSMAKADKPDDTTSGVKNKIEVKTDQRRNKRARAFVKFDVSSIPSGATVDSATVTLCIAKDPGHTRPTDLHRATGAWSENAVTWNNQPTVAATATDTQNAVPLPGCMTWTVTSDVQLWVDGTANNGWRLSDPDEMNSVSYKTSWQSKETVSVPPLPPKLDVTYTPVYTMRHHKTIQTLNGSDQVTSVTVEGTKDVHSGTINITVDLLDGSSVIVDQGIATLSTASGAYSEVVTLTLGNVPYVQVARIDVAYVPP